MSKQYCLTTTPKKIVDTPLYLTVNQFQKNMQMHRSLSLNDDRKNKINFCYRELMID